MAMPARVIYTVGHSTRSLDEFIALLRAHGVAAVADVRRFPGSKRLPHFNDDSLATALPKARIEYIPIPLLGGRRQTSPGSPNTGWRNASFRGYADYMQSPDFLTGLDQLITQAGKAPTTTMCAEAVPWRCHRSLISDALLVRGWEVIDILSPTKSSPHKLTSFASVNGTKITYPASPEPGLFAP